METIADTAPAPPDAGVHHLADFRTSPRVLLITAVAIVVGLAGLAAGVVLLRLIGIVTNMAYFGRVATAMPDLGRSPLGVLAVFVPILGALIVGLMARYGSDRIRGHGIPEALEAILLGRSRLSFKVAILKPLSSAISIGTGGPFGAEGPIIMTGGAIGSLLAQLLPVTDTERKTLLVAGAAAGMTAVFGTPIAAILLAVELLLFEWSPGSFIPVAAAAITAEVGRHALGMPGPLFPFRGGMPLSIAAVMLWCLVGLAAGLLSGLLTRLVYACEDVFQKLPIHWMWWPMLGGAAVGIGGLIDPRALGVGYPEIGLLLRGGIPPASALLLLAVKGLIWSMALGSGTSGGVLAPLLIIGGALGAVAAPLLAVASPGFWPLLAMCATMGGTMRSPLTATFFAVELTGNTHVLLPLLVACATAHLVTVLLMRRSILTEKVARRGHHLEREYRVDPFTITKVADIMVTEVETLSATMTLYQAAAHLTDPATRHPSFPVLDEAGRPLGIVDPPRVLAWRRAGEHRHTPLLRLLARHRLRVAYPDEYAGELAERMMRLNTAHLPVVARADGRLVGYVSWRDLMKVRVRERDQDEARMVFYRVR
ncbi:MAG: chloride channel protein [Rhodospirillales bacterium]|nr:chloride channel protein [Rhodospirillales bacterium]